jgi:Na+-transporting NADH:ubiquinone oxidoreductase subunit NqrD
MMSRGNNCHNIGSLRELRSLQHANEVAKEAAAGRVKSGVAGAFSLSCLFVTLVRHYAPGNIKHIMQMISKFSKQ